ncbi:MAG: hypothetical protein KBT07_07390 [Clostridiales bacterium]|nr:hypothetical protein [Candidatus Scatonaster coprocaballi]
MSNLFRMHIYRALKAKSTKVIGILLGVFFAITLILAYVVFENPFDIPGDVLDVLVGVKGKGTVPFRIHSFFTQMNSPFIILMTIFTVLLVTSDFSRGYVKNIYGMFQDKSKFVFAKWSAMVVSVSTIYVAYSLLSLGVTAICFKSFEMECMDLFFKSFIVEYILLIALLTLVFMITSLFKSASGGMVIGLIMASGMMQSIEHLLDLIIAKITGQNLADAAMDTLGGTIGITEKSGAFRLSNYCIDNVFLTYHANMDYADTVRSIIVAIAWTAFALAICTLLAKKKDVRC